MPFLSPPSQFNLGNSKFKDALPDGKASTVLKAVTEKQERPSTGKNVTYAAKSESGLASGYWIRGESQRKDPHAPSLFI